MFLDKKATLFLTDILMNESAVISLEWRRGPMFIDAHIFSNRMLLGFQYNDWKVIA